MAAPKRIKSYSSKKLYGNWKIMISGKINIYFFNKKINIFLNFFFLKLLNFLKLYIHNTYNYYSRIYNNNYVSAYIFYFIRKIYNLISINYHVYLLRDINLIKIFTNILKFIKKFSIFLKVRNNNKIIFKYCKKYGYKYSKLLQNFYTFDFFIWLIFNKIYYSIYRNFFNKLYLFNNMILKKLFKNLYTYNNIADRLNNMFFYNLKINSLLNLIKQVKFDSYILFLYNKKYKNIPSFIFSKLNLILYIYFYKNREFLLNFLFFLKKNKKLIFLYKPSKYLFKCIVVLKIVFINLSFILYKYHLIGFLNIYYYYRRFLLN